MIWWDLIKANRSISGDGKDRSRRKVARGSRTTPRGSRQAKLEKLVEQLLSGRITEEQYRKRKEELQ